MACHNLHKCAMPTGMILIALCISAIPISAQTIDGSAAAILMFAMEDRFAP
jgi:hypothetical protein